MRQKIILQKIEQYLEGRLSAEDFSYDFPVTYSLYAKYLDATNLPLSQLLEKELKSLCQKYDPRNFYNIEGEKCLSETEFKNQVATIYKKAKTLATQS